MYQDNEEAKALAETLQGSRRSKHIDALSFSAGAHEVGQVTIHSVASAEQYVDILMKPLGREAFRRHRGFLMNRL